MNLSAPLTSVGAHSGAPLLLKRALVSRGVRATARLTHRRNFNRPPISRFESYTFIYNDIL